MNGLLRLLLFVVLLAAGISRLLWEAIIESNTPLPELAPRPPLPRPVAAPETPTYFPLPKPQSNT